MCSMFVSEETVAVSDGENTIYRRAKMGRGVEARVSADFMSLGGASQRAYNLVLLYHNIVSWHGPAFTVNGNPVPCTRKYIDLLDPEEPLIAAVLEEIAADNLPKTAVAPPSLNGNFPKVATR